MTTTPAVSIVMPVYRPEPRHFAEALDSILAQSFNDWEMVIVEDPSDRTGREVVERRNDPRIRYILSSRRTSLPRQHNRAVLEARSPLIARFDADDVCEPDRIARQAEFLGEHPDIDVVASQLTIIDDNGDILATRDYPSTHEEIVRAMHRYNPISGSNAMFRRRVVQAVGGWREDSPLPAQDYDWYSRVALQGFRFAILPDRLVRYRVHSGQIKTLQLRGTLRTSLEVRRRHWLPFMNAAERLRLLADHLALLAPQAVVLGLYRMSHYQARR